MLVYRKWRIFSVSHLYKHIYQATSTIVIINVSREGEKEEYLSVYKVHALGYDTIVPLPGLRVGATSDPRV